jgi:hypothetical protein
MRRVLLKLFVSAETKMLVEKMKEEVILTIDSYHKSLIDKGMAPLTSYYIDMIKKDAIAAIM